MNFLRVHTMPNDDDIPDFDPGKAPVSRVEFCPGVVNVKTPFTELWLIDWPMFEDLTFAQLPGVVAAHVLEVHDEVGHHTQSDAFSLLLERLDEHDVLTERARMLLERPDVDEETGERVEGLDPFESLFDDPEDDGTDEQEPGWSEDGPRRTLMYWLCSAWPALAQALAR